MADSLDGLWVKSDVAADGSYVACVEIGADRSIPMGRDRALAYAMAVLTAVMHAEHDAAVLAQFVKIGLAQKHAAEAVATMRERRAPVDDDATAPLRWLPGVSAFTGKGFLHLLLDGEAFCQIEPAAAIGHALYVLRSVTAVDVDSVYFRYLTRDLDVPEARARAVVADIGNFYEEPSK